MNIDKGTLASKVMSIAGGVLILIAAHLLASLVLFVWMFLSITGVIR